MTGLDLISSALRQFGAFASGEPIPASNAQDARSALNAMLDSWNAERLTIFTSNRVTFPLPDSVQTRTLGTGGDWNMARPSKIEEMSVVVNGIEYPVDYFTEEAEWQAVWLKSNTSSWPSRCWDDGGFPLRTLSFWPIPNNGAVSVILYPWVPLTSFTDLVTDNLFPPGYAEALKYNLAIRLCPEYDKPISGDLAALAMSSLGRVKSANIPKIDLVPDPAVSGGANRMGSTGVVSSAGFNSGYYPWW